MIELEVQLAVDQHAVVDLLDKELIKRFDVGDYRFQDDAFSERVKNRGLDT